MNSLCVQEYIGRGSRNNRFLWFGQSKGEITSAVSQFEVEAIVSRYATAQLIKMVFLQIECYLLQI